MVFGRFSLCFLIGFPSGGFISRGLVVGRLGGQFIGPANRARGFDVFILPQISTVCLRQNGAITDRLCKFHTVKLLWFLIAAHHPDGECLQPFDDLHPWPSCGSDIVALEHSISFPAEGRLIQGFSWTCIYFSCSYVFCIYLEGRQSVGGGGVPTTFRPQPTLGVWDY